MQPGHGPVWRPLKRHDSHVAEQMVERAAELARDSHAQTRYAAVLVKDESLLAWGTNGVPFPAKALLLQVRRGRGPRPLPDSRRAAGDHAGP